MTSHPHTFAVFPPSASSSNMRSSAQGGAKDTHQLFGLGGHTRSVAPIRHEGICFSWPAFPAVGASYLDRTSATTLATPGICSTTAGTYVVLERSTASSRATREGASPVDFSFSTTVRPETLSDRTVSVTRFFVPVALAQPKRNQQSEGLAALLRV